MEWWAAAPQTVLTQVQMARDSLPQRPIDRRAPKRCPPPAPLHVSRCRPPPEAANSSVYSKKQAGHRVALTAGLSLRCGRHYKSAEKTFWHPSRAAQSCAHGAAHLLPQWLRRVYAKRDVDLAQPDPAPSRCDGEFLKVFGYCFAYLKVISRGALGFSALLGCFLRGNQ